MIQNNYDKLLPEIKRDLEELNLSYKKEGGYYKITKPILKGLSFLTGLSFLIYMVVYDINPYENIFMFLGGLTSLIIVPALGIGIPLNYQVERNNFKINAYRRFIKNKHLLLKNSREIFNLFLKLKLVNKNFKHYEYSSFGGVFFDKSIFFTSNKFTVLTEEISTYKENLIVNTKNNNCIVSKIQFNEKYNLNFEVNYIPDKGKDLFDLEIVSSESNINSELQNIIKNFINNNGNKKAYHLVFKDDLVLIKYDKFKSFKNSALFKERVEEQYCELIFVKQFAENIESLIN